VRRVTHEVATHKATTRETITCEKSCNNTRRPQQHEKSCSSPRIVVAIQKKLQQCKKTYNNIKKTITMQEEFNNTRRLEAT